MAAGAAPRYENRTQKDQEWREQASKALARAGLMNEAEDFRTCGDPDQVYWYLVCEHDPEHYCKAMPHTCHLRYCPECAHRETGRLMKHYLPHIRQVVKNQFSKFRLRHIVLTTHFSLRDPDARERYIGSWRAVSKVFDLILGEGWNKSGQGYIASSEFGEQGLKLHFHVLFYGQYIDQKKLSQAWNKITGETITYIREVKNAKKAANEVLKYCTKLTDVPAEDIPLLHAVLKGTRRIRSRGIFYDLPPVLKELAACPICNELLIRCSKPYLEYQQSIVALVAAIKDQQRAELHLIQGNKSPPLVVIKLPGFEQSTSIDGFF